MKTLYRILWVISMIINAFFIGFTLLLGFIAYVLHDEEKTRRSSYSRYNYSKTRDSRYYSGRYKWEDD